MAKLILMLLFSFSGTAAIASSDIVSLVNLSGELVINIVDRINAPPYEATLLWSTIVGAGDSKSFKTSTFSLVCIATFSQPLNQRFGSCRLVIGKEKVLHSNSYYGAVLTDPEILSKMAESNLRFADGKLLITSDHAQGSLGIMIDEGLVKHP